MHVRPPDVARRVGARSSQRLGHAEGRDEGAASYPLILAVSYPDLAAVDAALQSKVRFESREVTKELLAMFTGSVHHHVCEANTYPPAA